SLLGMPAGAVLIMPTLGWIIARWGAGRVTFVSALVFCLTTVLPSLSWNMPTLITALFCIGLTSGAMDIAMNAEASAVELASGEPIMSTCHGFWSIGGMVGAALGGIIASWHVPFTLHMAVLIALMLVLVVLRRGTLLAALPVLSPPQRLFALPTGPLIGLAVMAFCVMIGEGAMIDWSAVYLKNTLGTGAAVAGFGYALFSMSMAVGRLHGDQLYTRFTTAVLVQRSGLIAAIGLGGALLLANPTAALVGFACAGLGFASMVPIVYRSATKAPGMLPGTGLAAVATAGYAGMFAGPPLIGFTAEAVGLGSALGIVVALLLLVALMAPRALKAIPQHT
ncbi:MAG TPA: MFS transporter, partial [Rhodothermales bacterium]|nr:MFS transporter [Rhodothermales bacterium]